MNKKLKIGILGSRGIPNRYGGYEQFAEYLSAGLVERGHRVYVYNSSLHPYQSGQWKGVNIIHCYDPEDKLGTFGQFVYDWNCFRDARKRGFDILLQLGYTSNAIWYPFWPKKAKNFIHMDGLEWQRSKYHRLIRFFLKKVEALAAGKGDGLIADSMAIQRHIQERYKRPAVYIAYGAKPCRRPDEAHLNTYSLQAGQYYLLVARFVPENMLEKIILGYLQAQTGLPLVLIGNTANKYGQYLVDTYKSPDISFVGSIFDKKVLDSLRFFCRLYFHGHSVGGTNPSLLDAMACSAIICAHDNVFNRAILGEDAFFFTESEDIVEVLKRKKTKDKGDSWRRNNLNKIEGEFNWNRIIQAYEDLFLESCGQENALTGN